MKSKNSTRFLLILLLSFAQRLCRYTFIKLFTFLMTSDISVFKHFIHQMLRCEMLQQLFWCLWNDD